MDLPASLADFGPAALAAVVVAGYLLVGEPLVGHVLHRRFEGRLRTDPGARRSFYRRLLVLEWGLSLLVLAVWLAAPEVDAAAVGLGWPQSWPGPLTWAAVVLVLLFVLVSTRALRGGALTEVQPPARRAGRGRHAQPPASAHLSAAELPAATPSPSSSPASATLALLPRTAGERRLFTVVGITAGVCEEWLYRGFFIAVASAVAGGLPDWALVGVAAVAFGLAHAYQGGVGVVATGVLGGILAALYVGTGSLLLPVLLHAAIDLRFLLVPARVLPDGRRPA